MERKSGEDFADLVTAQPGLIEDGCDALIPAPLPRTAQRARIETADRSLTFKRQRQMNHRSERPAPRSKPKRSRIRPFPKDSEGPVEPGRARAERRPETAARIPRGDRAEPPRPEFSSRQVSHVAPLDRLAESAVEIALAVERGVLGERKRADRLLASALKDRRDLAPPDHRFISQSVFALFRWLGWIEPLRLPRPEARLLLAWMLDATTIHPACRVWARKLGHDPHRLFGLGDAPNWTARAEGLKRWLGIRAVNADPWRLFPDWLRDQLPLPPGTAPPKQRYLELLQSLQRRPSLWVRAQGPDEKAIWAELAEAGLKPWIHRRHTRAARLDPESDVHHLPAFQRGELEIQDLASQAVALICDPDPGERWWDACAGAGGKSLHLAALMGGKGVVVATDTHSGRLKEAVRRARRSPFRNLTTKPWDGKHVAGKPKSFDGVLVDAPCSAIGTWRRNPDARWLTDREAVARLAALQAQILNAASAGVRAGGALVYSVCTLSRAETNEVVKAFLETHADFTLDPFPHPFQDAPTTDGTLQVWPQEFDSDAMFIARMVRNG